MSDLPSPHTTAIIGPLRTSERLLDWAFVSICLIAGLTGLRIVTNSDYWSARALGTLNAARIGMVSREQGTVRHRSNDSMAWRDLGDAQIAISEGDTVFTGDSGIARITITRSSEAKVLPNSLVTVRSERNATQAGARWLATAMEALKTRSAVQALSIEKGHVKLQLQAGKHLSIRAKGREYQLESLSKTSSLDLSFDPQAAYGAGQLQLASGMNSELKVTQGAASDQQTTIMIGTHQTVTFDSKPTPSIHSLALVPASPNAGERVLTTEAKAWVPFKWEARGEIPANSNLSLEIVGAQSLSKAIKAQATTHSIALTPGNYSWRLSMSRESETVSSPWVAFTIASLVAPRQLGPSPGAVILITEPASQATPSYNETVTLNWSPARRVEIEIMHEGTATNHITELPSLSLDLPIGNYSWRIRGVEDGLHSPWSEAIHFSVRKSEKAKNAMPIRPTLTVAAQAISTRLRSADILDRLPVVLRWPAVQGAREYHIAVNNQDEVIFERLIPASANPQAALTIDSLSQNYSYQVIALLNTGDKISSDPVPLALELSAPVPTRPQEGARFAIGRDVLITWERTLLTKSYQIQIAIEPAFRQPIISVTGPNNFYPFTMPKEGRYYWRVKSLSGSQESRWTPIRSFFSKGR